MINIPANNKEENKSHAVANDTVQRSNSNEAVHSNEQTKQLKAYHQMANNSPQALQLRAVQAMADDSRKKEKATGDITEQRAEPIEAKQDTAPQGFVWPVQRIVIDGERIRPYGQNGKELWEEVKKEMIITGLSPHGAKKIFLQKAKAPGQTSRKEFIQNFILEAKQEVSRVDLEKKTLPKEERTRGWTRTLKLSRPSWTVDHKEGVEKGHDIRHVVRNATIRDALKKEFDTQMLGGPQQALVHFQKLAGALKLDSNANTAWELLDRIYKAAYLNFGNLFGGAGGINRVIGLTADDIYNAGAKLLGSQETASPDEIENLFDWVAQMIANKSDQTESQIWTAFKHHQINEEGVNRFLTGMEEFFDNISDYLIDVEEDLVSQAEIQKREGNLFGGVLKSQIGHILLEIGANFGFDLPINAVGNDHMETLLKAEIFLSQYDGKNPGILIEVLSKFLELQNILSKSK